MITKLTTLAREIREVIPGTESVFAFATGSISVNVATDEYIRSFAASIGREAREVETLGVRWLQLDAGTDDEPIIVSGPQTEIERGAR